MSTKIDSRQAKNVAALPMVGSSANATLDTIFPLIDSELSKLFEDRNILLADGGTIALTANGQTLSFTSPLLLHINSQVAGGAPTVIDLAATSRTFTATGRMLYAVIDRLAGTATVTADATTLSAVTSANKEVVLIAKRIDSADGTAQVYFRNGFALVAGQSSRFGVDPILTNKRVAYSSADDSTTTGANATLTAFTTGIVRLTNSSLTSIAGIPAGTSGQSLIIENKTGNFLTVGNDDSNASSANRIFTGAGAPISMPNNATFTFTYDSTGTHWMLTGGSGSGSGGGGSKNYLSSYIASLSSGIPNAGNGNFEFGSVTGFSLGTTGTLTNGIPTGTPTFGSGASGNLSISAVNSGQLAGGYSMSYASSAASTAGNMVASSAFYIDAEDQAKILTWKFYYKAQTNPTNANWSGTSSNSFGVAVWDVTNSVWLQTSSNFGMTQNSGVGMASGSFQTNLTTAQLRFIIYNANATSGAVTVYFDDISVGPQTIPFGVPASDWTPYTLVFGGTTSAPTDGAGAVKTAFWRRVGDSMEIMVNYRQSSAGSAGSGSYLIPLPAGYSMDLNKVSLPSTPGTATVLNSGGSAVGSSYIASTTANTTSRAFPAGTVSVITSTALTATFTTDNVPQQAFPFSSSFGVNFSTNPMYFNMFATVPIAGWSANVQMSSDSDTRIVMAKASGTPANTTALNPIIYPTLVFDTHAAYNSTTGRYTVPVSGKYRISAMIDISAVSFLIIYKNGVADTGGNIGYTSGNIGLCTGIVDCVAGDIIDLRPDTGTGGHTPRNHSITFERISGPTTIAASESINASYYCSTNQSASASTPINFDTKDYDSHNAVTTGSSWVFTAPSSGVYWISMNGDVTVSTDFRLLLYKNGSAFKSMSGVIPSSTAGGRPSSSTSVKLLAGDTIQIRPTASQTFVGGTLSTGGTSIINIMRAGN